MANTASALLLGPVILVGVLATRPAPRGAAASVRAPAGAERSEPARAPAGRTAIDAPPRRFVGVTRPSENLAIGSAQKGVIARLAVEEGQHVAKGQLLFQLETTLEELEVERTRIEAASDTVLREAQARLLQAEREEKRVIDLHQRDIAGDSELDTRRREADVARIKLAEAKAENLITGLRHAEARARLAQRIVHSPIDGYVAERMRARGESVDELQPVVRVMQLDPLWVEFDCPMEDAALFPRGGHVSVRPENEPGAVATADVLFASETADAASQTFRVRLELRGHRHWKAGRKVLIEPVVR